MFILCALLPEHSTVTAFHFYYTHWISYLDVPYFTVVDRSTSLASTEIKQNLHSLHSQLCPTPTETLWTLGSNERSYRFLQKAINRLLLQPDYRTGPHHSVLLSDVSMAWNLTLYVKTFCHFTSGSVLCHVFLASLIHLQGYRNDNISCPWPLNSLLKAETMSYSTASKHHTNETSPPYVISISNNVSGFSVESTAGTKLLSPRWTSPPSMSFTKTAFTLPIKLVYVLTSERYPSHRNSSTTQTQTAHHFRSQIFHLLPPITHTLPLHLKPPHLKAVPQFRNS